MDNDAVFAELCSFLHTTFGIPEEKLAPESNIREELDLDSIDVFDLLAAFEKRHGIQLSLHDFKDAVTIEDVVKLLQASLAAKSSAVRI